MPIEKLKQYFESEYNLTRPTKHQPSVNKEDIFRAIQRCLGAAYLAWMMGADWGEVELAFNAIKERLDKLEAFVR